MPFSEMEWVYLLKTEGLTDIEIAGRAGGAERTIRAIKKMAGRRSSAFENSLDRTGTEAIHLPWPAEAHDQARRMLALIGQGRWNDLQEGYAFSSRTSVQAALATDPVAAVSPEQWGHALIAYVFQLGMQFSSLGSHVRYREDWDAVVEVMLALLKHRDENWARVLRFKVSGNRIVLTWKRTTPRSARASAEMRTRIEKADYRNQLVAYNDLVPGNAVAPFNALAIASRFGERERYPDLLFRLQRADRKYRDVASIIDPNFDDDFDDFRDWLRTSYANRNAAFRERRQNLPESAMNREDI